MQSMIRTQSNRFSTLIENYVSSTTFLNTLREFHDLNEEVIKQRRLQILTQIIRSKFMIRKNNAAQIIVPFCKYVEEKFENNLFSLHCFNTLKSIFFLLSKRNGKPLVWLIM